jgi:hypothetical protein
MNPRTRGVARRSPRRVVGVACLLVGASWAAPVLAGPADSVTICHATGSSSNPYVQITVYANAVREGRAHNRDGHQDGEDIIPPGPSDPDGRNWDPEHQTIFDDGCLVFLPTVLPPSR